jgi:hypothetical protein
MTRNTISQEKNANFAICGKGNERYNRPMPKLDRLIFRVSGKEWDRFQEVWQLVLDRTLGQAKVSNFLKELIGVRPLRMVRPTDISYIRHEIDKLPDGKFEDSGRPTSSTRVNLRKK